MRRTSLKITVLVTLASLVPTGMITGSFARRRARVALAGVLLLGMLLMASIARPAPASASYSFHPQHNTGMCLDVAHASHVHGANVIQGRCWGGDNQEWWFESTGGGYYKLIARHSHKCLDVKYASTAHAADVVQANCTGTYNQQWRLDYVTESWYGGRWHVFYRIVARHSGMCLDVAHQNPNHGADVIQGVCWGGPNQLWEYS